LPNLRGGGGMKRFLAVCVAVGVVGSAVVPVASAQSRRPRPPQPPSNTARPVVSGSTVQGQTLSTTNGSWSSSPTSYSYQWQSCSTSCTNVGSNQSTYTTQASDDGSKIQVVVTATNAAGSASAMSTNSVGPITAPLPPPPPPAASAATPLIGEQLSGTGTPTGGSMNGNCSSLTSGKAGFQIDGTASGPYPGSFSETGSISVLRFTVTDYLNHQTYSLWRTSFSANVTITSGSTTITETTSATNGSWGGGPICDSAGHVGFTAAGDVSFTATIDGTTSSGLANLGGTFYAAPGAQDSVGGGSVYFQTGNISGSVVDSRTGAQLAGICVDAYALNGNFMGSTQTDSSGAYTLSGLSPGSFDIEFSSGCGASGYVAQYYNAEPSLASANPVTVTSGATTSGINAAMVN
jgi:hypothetical protein